MPRRPRKLLPAPSPPPPGRRLFALVSALCLLAALLTLDAGFRGGTLTVRLEWYHLPLLVPPLAWVLRDNARRFEERQRADRRRAGLCPACGYDLTGNVSGTCPECGTPTPAREAP